ncbi:hypothetical protein [Xanthobacter autotrophicus]|uniref:hypothetical protein n=1 Tax=Xanthobacter autotrophicus TaxID=280 RepID=UPI003726D3B1
MTTFKANAVRLAVLGALAGAGLMATAGTSEAVVYCRTVGYPKGCVARAPAAVVVRPAPAVVVAPAAGAVVVAPRRVIYCSRPGYPRGCVVR